MSYPLHVLPRAFQDIKDCYEWISQYSEAAAERWYAELNKALDRVCRGPASYPKAAESRRMKLELRAFLFYDNSRRRYHGVFLFVDEQVYVLRIRGPGQPPLTAHEIDIPLSE